VLFAIYYPLTACVIIERTVCAYKNLSFDKQQSRHVAKIVIPSLILYHFLVTLHKPFHRQLLSDTHSSNRSWCFLHHRIWFFNTYERATNIVRLVLPFFLNLLAPLIMLSIRTRHKATLNKNATTWSNFKSVLCTYKNNIISPCLLVLLITPRLILTFHVTCITQQWQNTTYLVAYFLLLVPLMTSFFIFLLPCYTIQ
jgi:hypothetical protein